MDNMQNVLKGLNQCEFTGYEKAVSTDKLGTIEINQYADNFGRNRFTVSIDGTTAAGILFDADNVCEFKYTLTDYRRQGMMSQLWAYASTKIGTLKHSEDLTELGKLTVK